MKKNNRPDEARRLRAEMPSGKPEGIGGSQK